MSNVTLIDQLVAAREKVVELETKMYERLRHGVLVLTTGDGEDGDLCAGTAGRVQSVCLTEEYGVKVEPVNGGNFDWFRVEDVEIVESADEIRAALYAEADRRVDDLLSKGVVA